MSIERVEDGTNGPIDGRDLGSVESADRLLLLAAQANLPAAEASDIGRAHEDVVQAHCRRSEDAILAKTLVPGSVGPGVGSMRIDVVQPQEERTIRRNRVEPSGGAVAHRVPAVAND